MNLPRKFLFFVAILTYLIATAGSFFVYTPTAAAAPNLIVNPSLETAGTSGNPQDWLRGGYGANTRLLTYPVTGFTSPKAARVEITSYSGGDAKWYFKEVPVAGGQTYKFSDVFRSNITSYVTLQIRHSDNRLSYKDISGPMATSDQWRSFSASFTTPATAVSLTVFHLIKNVGWLETDDYSLGQVTNPNQFPQGMVSFNFDDGYKSAYLNGLPILEAAGFKSDQFIITDRMNPRFPGYVTVEQVQDMQARGHEIGAHTRTHPALTSLSSEQAKNEIQGSRQDLINIGINPVDFFAYPYGDYNAAVIQQVKEAGFKGARCSDGGYNSKTQNLYTLKRQPVLVTTSVDQMKSYVDSAVQNKTWLILLFHEVNDSGNQYSITPANLNEIVNYVKQKNVPTVTLSQGRALMNQ